MLIFSTAFAGAWLVVLGITFYTKQWIRFEDLEAYYRAGGNRLYMILLCWILLPSSA